MVDINKINELDEKYSKDLKAINVEREEWEQDYHHVSQRNDELKDLVYQATVGKGIELSDEARLHLSEMDNTLDKFSAQYHQAIAVLDEKEIQLKKDYDKKLDALYESDKEKKETKKLQNNS